MPRQAAAAKRLRPAATTATLRASRRPAHPAPTSTAEAQLDGEEDDEAEDDVDWAAEFEDVEETETEHKQQTAVTSSGSQRVAHANQKSERGSKGLRPRTAFSSSQSVQQRLLEASAETTPGPSRPLYLQFDYHFLLPLPSSLPPHADRAAYRHSLHAAFTTAFADRVSVLRLQPTAASAAGKADSGSGSAGGGRGGGGGGGGGASHLLLSLLLSHPSTTPFRTLDLGPETSSAAASEWRSFWLDRSELRRFKDGRVLECVMWRCEGELEAEEERRMGEAAVLMRMARWVMTRKGQLKDTTAIRFVGWQAHQLLKRRQLQSARPLLLESNPSLVSSPLEAATLQSTFTALSSLLKTLSLPLSFTSITAVHPSFRYSDPFPPLPLSAAVLSSSPAVRVIDVVCQFESSSAWPGSLYAIQQIKTAFVIELAAALQSSPSALLASTTVSYTHLDVLTAQPAAYCFRLHLLHHAETPPLSLLLHQSVRSFALRRGEGGLWAGLVCLAKRWAQCHMYGELLADYVVELLCAAWWMEMGRGEEEADETGLVDSRQAAGASRGATNPMVLLIGWLEWLGAYDFTSGPLVVPLPAISSPAPTSHPSALSAFSVSASSLFDRALAAYKARSAAATASSPLPALYLACPVDLASSISSPHLTAALLSRLQLTASSCSSHLASLVSRCELAGWMSAFKPDTSSFDLQLHLKPQTLGWDTLQSSVGRVTGLNADEQDGQQQTAAAAGQADVQEAKGRRRRVQQAYKPPLDERKEGGEEQQSRAHELLLGVDVQLELVRALQQHFGAYMDVHADLYGGTVIGVRMKQAGGGRWKVSESGYTSWRVGAATPGAWNVHEMLADVELIGQGIVEQVERNSRNSA